VHFGVDKYVLWAIFSLVSAPTVHALLSAGIYRYAAEALGSEAAVGAAAHVYLVSLAGYCMLRTKSPRASAPKNKGE
jgi:hypothetical protein